MEKGNAYRVETIYNSEIERLRNENQELKEQVKQLIACLENALVLARSHRFNREKNDEITDNEN